MNTLMWSTFGWPVKLMDTLLNTKSKNSTRKEATCDAERVAKDWKQSLIDYGQMDKEIFKAQQTAWKNDGIQSQADCWDG